MDLEEREEERKVQWTTVLTYKAKQILSIIICNNVVISVTVREGDNGQKELV